MLWTLLACLDAPSPDVGGRASESLSELPSGDTATEGGVAPATAGPTASTGWKAPTGASAGTGGTGGLVASGGTAGTGDTAATGDTAGTGSTSDTSATGPGAPTGDTGGVPLIDEALLGRCDPTQAVAVGAGGDDLFRVTLPAGRCNDGTPAVAYVRAATDPAHADDWVIYLDGGNRCATGEECSIRWCGEDFHNARKMSSRWESEDRGIEGIDGDGVRNALAGWNHVQVPYCSSDNWVGRRSDVVLSNAQGVAFRVHFEGALIVESLIDTLEQGAVSDDGQVALAPLGGASRVVMAGSSAGAVGVMAHLDRLAERLAPVEVLGVLDAMSGPSEAHLTAAQQALAEASGQRQWNDEFVAVYDAQADDSCLANAGSTWECIVATPLQADHVTTPFFLHFDLRDNLIQEVFASFGLSSTDFAEATAATMTDLAAARPEVGVHATTCAQHVFLDADRWFHDLRLPVDGVDQSLHDALVSWLDGQPVIAVDDPSAPQSVCP